MYNYTQIVSKNIKKVFVPMTRHIVLGTQAAESNLWSNGQPGHAQIWWALWTPPPPKKIADAPVI
jgi:hypothetical protein